MIQIGGARLSCRGHIVMLGPMRWANTCSLWVVSGEDKPAWQGWKAIKNRRQGEYAPAPTVAYEWTVHGLAWLVTVLYPSRRGEECPVHAVIASSDVGSTDIQIAWVDGSTVELNELDF